jgi:hypothetical protein
MTTITVPGSFADARIRTSGEAGRRWIDSLCRPDDGALRALAFSAGA